MKAPAEHIVRAADGWRLSVLDLAPPGPARGLVIAGHAMMVDRRTLHRAGRPCLAAALVDAGFRVLVPDLRGHGRSGPTPDAGGDWSYDQLVEDTAVLVELARGLAPDLKLATLGHSLFGHTTLAHLSRAPDTPIAAHVALGGDVWLPGAEDRRGVWPVKRAAIGLAVALSRVFGCVPARRLGFGSADEAFSYFSDFPRCAREGAWLARDGHDYGAGLARVTCPVLLVLSEGDPVAPPRVAMRLWSRLPRHELLRLGPAPAGAPEPGIATLPELRPGHMALVTDPASAPAWHAIATWLGSHLAP